MENPPSYVEATQPPTVIQVDPARHRKKFLIIGVIFGAVMLAVIIIIAVEVRIITINQLLITLKVVFHNKSNSSGQTITINVQSANTKQLWMEDMQTQFNNQQLKSSTGKIMQVWGH